MGQKQTKKRIFAREEVNVDSRTPGIKGASHATRALGDVNGRQVITRDYAPQAPSSSSAAAWATVSQTLGNIMDHMSKMEQRAYSEKQKQEDRAYSEARQAENRAYEENKYQQRKAEERAEREQQKAADRADKIGELTQTNKGVQTGIEFNLELKAALDRGEINSVGEARDLLDKKLEGFQGVASDTFIRAFQSKALGGYEHVGNELVLKNQALLQNVGMQAMNSATEKMFQGIEDYADAAAFKADFDMAIELGVTSGLSEPIAVKYAFQSGLSAMNAAALENRPLQVQAIADNLLSNPELLHKIAPDSAGRTAREQVFAALDSITKTRENNEFVSKTREREERNRGWQENATKLFTETSKMSAPEIEAVLNQHRGMAGDELWGIYGIHADSVLTKLESDYKYREGYVSPDQQRKFLKFERLMSEKTDSPLIWDDDYFFEQTADLTPPHREALEKLREAGKDTQTSNYNTFVEDSVRYMQEYLSPVDGNGRPVDDPKIPYKNVELFQAQDESGNGALTWAGEEYRRRLYETMKSSVNPADPRFKDNPTALTSAYFDVVQGFERTVKGGQADWLVEAHNAAERDPKQKALKNPLTYSSAELSSNPEARRELDLHALGRRVMRSEQKIRIDAIQDPLVKMEYKQKYANNTAAKLVADIEAVMDTTNAAIENIQAQDTAGLAVDPSTVLAMRSELQDLKQQHDSAVEAQINVQLGNISQMQRILETDGPSLNPTNRKNIEDQLKQAEDEVKALRKKYRKEESE